MHKIGFLYSFAPTKSAAAFAAKFLVQPPPKKNIRLSRIGRLAAEIFDQPADSRKKFGLYGSIHRLDSHCLLDRGKASIRQPCRHHTLPAELRHSICTSTVQNSVVKNCILTAHSCSKCPNAKNHGYSVVVTCDKGNLNPRDHRNRSRLSTSSTVDEFC